MKFVEMSKHIVKLDMRLLGEITEFVHTMP